VSEISFERETRAFAELAAVFITAVSNAHDDFERTLRTSKR